MKITYQQGSIAQVQVVERQIPEFGGGKQPETLIGRLDNTNHLILVAMAEGCPVAYKLGYALSNDSFYSWLGAVIPAYRRQGIATQLRLEQERWAINQGYKTISVKSMNRFPSMLQLLIASGYQVCGYENNGSYSNSKINFIKEL